MTPGAVSRQVQSLELFLGQQLFRREPREIVLTQEGEQYLSTISRCLDEIRDATEILCGPPVGQLLRIRSYMTFSMRWLIPRIGHFQESNPDIEIRITTSNDPVDFDRESVDAAVKLGDGNWPELLVERLIDNRITPVCSPNYLAENHHLERSRFGRQDPASFDRPGTRLASLERALRIRRHRSLLGLQICQFCAVLSGGA